MDPLDFALDKTERHTLADQLKQLSRDAEAAAGALLLEDDTTALWHALRMQLRSPDLRQIVTLGRVAATVQVQMDELEQEGVL